MKLIRFFRRLLEPSGLDKSRDFNRFHGRWRVRYRDGKISEPMCLDTAENYAAIFGGVVEAQTKPEK